MARRINQKFVGISSLVVLCAAAGIWIAQHLLIHEHADTYIGKAQQEMQDGHFTEAVDDLKIAGQLDPNNEKIPMMLGAAYHEVNKSDSNGLPQEIEAYKRVLTINPNSIPALERLIDIYMTGVQANPSSTAYEQLIGYANREAKLEPDNLQVAERRVLLVAEKYAKGFALVSGSEGSKQTDDVDAAIAGLSSFMAKDPANAELPFGIAQARIQQAVDVSRAPGAMQTGKQVAEKRAQAVSVFEGTFTDPKAPQDQNAAMHYHFGLILTQLADSETSDTLLRQKYLERGLGELDRAHTLSKPTDPDYLNINLNDAALLKHENKADQAIAVYRSLPSSPMVDLQLAQTLSSNHQRAEAERILDATLASLKSDPNSMDLVRFRVMLEVTQERITDFAATEDAAQKKQLALAIDPALAKLRERRGNSNPVDVDLLDARYKMAQEDYSGAVEELMGLYRSNPGAAKDPNVLSYLVNAFQKTNQPGEAIKYLTQLVELYPQALEQRKQLVELMLYFSMPEASVQLETLEKQAPGDPSLPIYELQMMANRGAKPADIRAKFDALAEGTSAEVLVKIRAAVGLHFWDDAVRLLNRHIADDPTDIKSQITLVKLYEQSGHHDASLALAEKALAASPNDPELRVLVPELKGETPAQIATGGATNSSEKDPLTSELDAAAAADRSKDFAGEEAHLARALGLHPDATSRDTWAIWDQLFKVYVKLGRFDDAGRYSEKLAAVDFDKVGGASYQFLLAKGQGDKLKAMAIAKKLAEEKPEFALSWLYLGQILQINGEYEPAMSQYDLVLERQKNNADAYRGLAECAYSLGKPDDAFNYIMDGLKATRGNSDLRLMAVMHEVNYGDPVYAIGLLKQQIGITPNDPLLYANLGEDEIVVAKSLTDHGKGANAGQFLSDARSVLEKALLRFPDVPSLYLANEDLNVTTNKLDDAEAILKQWASRDQWKTKPDPYIALANFYDFQKKPDDAEAQMRTAVSYSNNDPIVEVEMCQILLNHKKYDDAIKILQANNPTDPNVERALVEILVKADRFDAAQKQLETFLAGKPPNSEELLTLWLEILSDRKDIPGTIEKATLVLAIDPHDVPALLARGQALATKSPADLQGSFKDFSKVEELDPNDEHVHRWLAQLDAAMGHPDAAAGELNSILRIDPGNKEARMKLVEFYSDPSHPLLDQAIHLLKAVEGTKPFDSDADIFQGEAVLYARKKDLSNALAKSEKALSLRPSDPAILQSHLNLLAGAGQFQTILDLTNNLPAPIKDAWWVATARGLAFNNSKDQAQATTEFNRAVTSAEAAKDYDAIKTITTTIADHAGVDIAIGILTSCPQGVPVKLLIAGLDHRKNDDQAALAVLEPLLASVDSMSREDQMEVLSAAAVLYQGMDSQAMAAKSFEAYKKLLVLDPDNWITLNNLACLLADNFDPTRAVEGVAYAQKAADVVSKLGIDNGAVLDTQGWLMILSGKADKGVDLLIQVLQTKPSPGTYLHLSEGYLKLKNPDDAIGAANSGIRLISQDTQDISDKKLLAKLHDVVSRSEELKKTKAQAQGQ